MDQNAMASFRTLARNSAAVILNPIDDKRAKQRARRKVNREIGKKNNFLWASLRLFGHVFVITTAILITDWVFNNGLQTQLIYHGSNSGSMLSVLKNKAYHINAFIQRETEW